MTWAAQVLTVYIAGTSTLDSDGAEGFLGEVMSQMDQEGYAGVKPHKDRLGYSKGDLGKKGLERRKSMID